MHEILAYKSVLLSGTLVTIQLALCAVLLAIVLGLIGASCKLSSSRVARAIAELYTTTVRGIPDLVLMLLLYFGGQQILNSLGELSGLWGYVEINTFVAGFLTIGIVFGAYMTETFRGAILAVPQGQIDAAIASGMSKRQIFRRVTWPHLVHLALPGFSNNWLVLFKSTALVSVIGLHDLVFNAFAAGRSTRMLFTFLFFVFVVYLLLTAISQLGLRWVNSRYSKGMSSLSETGL